MTNYKDFKVLFTEKQIEAKVKSLALELKNKLDQYDPEDIVLVGLLKGVVFFFVDLIRALGSPDFKVELIKASSYVGEHSTGNVKISGKLDDPKGKVIVLVDDIIDTGRTLQKLSQYLKAKDPKEVITVVFLDKPSRRVVNFDADFAGFEIPDLFVIGYGLDCNENHRSLSDIRIFESDNND